MATMRQIRSRIRVAKNIEQITKAMKMVAAARLKRAQDRVEAARPFARSMSNVVARLAGAVDGAAAHPLLESRERRCTGLLLITADRGLCGSYNSAILRNANELLSALPKETVRLYAVGRKGVAFFRRRGYDVIDTHQINASGISVADAREIARQLRSDFEAGIVDEVRVVYTRFVTAITQEPRSSQLLPIVPPAGDVGGSTDEVLFEPSAGALLSNLLPRYLVTQVYQALLESVASEHGSRMTSMGSATDNAGKMISTLTLSLNRARQAAITKEISEIVSGAEALKG